MYNLVNSNFNRTYNPSGRQNALSDIKRLLTSRDVAAQSKACGYLIEVVSRYSNNSEERARMIEYLLDNDITVFLCEATSNLDFTLFMHVTRCVRLVWGARRFFSEEHAALALAAALRALAHCARAGAGSHQALDASMHFICDLLNGISVHQTTPALSHQSAYSAVQLLACLSSLAVQIQANQKSILSSALVLEALISYLPDNLFLNGSTVSALVDVLKKWFELMVGALRHAALAGAGGAGCERDCGGMLYVVLCQLGINALNLTKVVRQGAGGAGGGGARGLVQSIVSDAPEAAALQHGARDLPRAALRLATHLAEFTQEHQAQLATEEYGVFLRFLLKLFSERADAAALAELCDLLLRRGYLATLPRVQAESEEPWVRRAGALVLGELLTALAAAHLRAPAACARDIHTAVAELQRGASGARALGPRLRRARPHALLVYLYFHCQAAHNPQEAAAPLLPFLVELILRLPRAGRPPAYILKALWLVFAMSSLSQRPARSLAGRACVERATARLARLLQPPRGLYSHHPALLLWAFSSPRIPHPLRKHVISQWLKYENSLPTELISEASVWEILLNILAHSRDKATVEHCSEAVRECVEAAEEGVREEVSRAAWGALPAALAAALLDEQDSHTGSNVCHVLELATRLAPPRLEPELCCTTAQFVACLLSRDRRGSRDEHTRLDYVCLKLSSYLLGLADDQNDNRILVTFINRPKLLARVLAASDSPHEGVACAALQLLAHCVHYFTRYGYQPQSVLQLQTPLLARCLRGGGGGGGGGARAAALLQLLHGVLSAGRASPLALACDPPAPAPAHPAPAPACRALRALMFRIQLMLCCRVQDNEQQSSAGWKTLSAIFKYAIYTKNDTKLTAALTSQPWSHALVRFQLTRHPTPEFTAFLHAWVTLLNTTMQRSQERRSVAMTRHSLVIKTMLLLKKHFKVEAMEQDKLTGEKILDIVRAILRDSGLDSEFP